MKTIKQYMQKVLCGLCLLCVLCVSCEDYTEHNFGKPEELYEAVQVNTYTFELTADNYKEIATNEDNIALAQAADEDGTTLKHLQMVGDSACFVGNITPQEYLPAILKSLVGAGEYYSMTAGSSITVRFRQGELVPTDAYVPQQGDLTTSGKYLLVPKGMSQVLAGSNNEATGQTFDYGYIYPSGSTRYPNAVNALFDGSIKADEMAAKYLYNIDKDGDSWLLSNPDNLYMYLDGEHNTFQYLDDLGDIEEGMYPNWSITYDAENQIYDITNTETQQTILYGTQFNSAGAYADKKGEDGYADIQLYVFKANGSEYVSVGEDVEEVVFTLDEDGWQTKGDYLNCPLTGGTTLSDMDAVYEAIGWSIENKGSIGDLTYVWRYDATYGLRASAFKSSTYYPTDVWAISPSINLKKAEKPIFTFEQAQKYADDKNIEDDKVTDYLQVWLSTNFAGRGGLDAATWVNVTDKVEGTWPDGSDWTYYPMTLDLTEYAGQTNVCVAFRYISTDGAAATWEVKNVVCKEPEAEEE